MAAVGRGNQKSSTMEAAAAAAAAYAASEPPAPNSPPLSKSRSADDVIQSWKKQMSELESSTSPQGVMMNSVWSSPKSTTKHYYKKSNDPIRGLQQSRSTDDVIQSWKAKMSAFEETAATTTSTRHVMNSSWSANNGILSKSCHHSDVRDCSWGEAHLEELFVPSRKQTKKKNKKNTILDGSRSSLLRKIKSASNVFNHRASGGSHSGR